MAFKSGEVQQKHNPHLCKQFEPHQLQGAPSKSRHTLKSPLTVEEKPPPTIRVPSDRRC